MSSLLTYAVVILLGVLRLSQSLACMLMCTLQDVLRLLLEATGSSPKMLAHTKHGQPSGHNNPKVSDWGDE